MYDERSVLCTFGDETGQYGGYLEVVTEFGTLPLGGQQWSTHRHRPGYLCLDTAAATIHDFHVSCQKSSNLSAGADATMHILHRI